MGDKINSYHILLGKLAMKQTHRYYKYSNIIKKEELYLQYHPSA
jgi:hypothetical protein